MHCMSCPRVILVLGNTVPTFIPGLRSACLQVMLRRSQHHVIVRDIFTSFETVTMAPMLKITPLNETVKIYRDEYRDNVIMLTLIFMSYSFQNVKSPESYNCILYVTAPTLFISL